MKIDQMCGNVARVVNKADSKIGLEGKLEGRSPFRRPRLNGMIIWKWILWTSGAKPCTGLK